MSGRITARGLALVLAMVFAPAPPADEDGLRIEGVDLPWTMTLPRPWLGGTYYRLDRIHERLERKRDVSGGTEAAAEMIRVLRDQTGGEHGVEAAALHPRDFRDYVVKRYGKGPGVAVVTQVFVHHVAGGLPEARGDLLEVLKEVAAAAVAGDYPEGTEASIDRIMSGRSAGFDAWHMVVEVDLSDGESVREVFHLVDLTAHGTHLFQFRADDQRFWERYEDFKGMLDTLRYDLPGGAID